MDYKLKDKVAIVTGAARDVGREIARTLPAGVHFTKAIPRTGSGKTMRYTLRDALLAER